MVGEEDDGARWLLRSQAGRGGGATAVVEEVDQWWRNGGRGGEAGDARGERGGGPAAVASKRRDSGWEGRRPDEKHNAERTGRRADDAWRWCSGKSTTMLGDEDGGTRGPRQNLTA
uniref:DUF834 domain-containing protein n=1 Tax=Setaria viridis TaxID=4556 RepID=A0A4U6W8K0_SETVI|nr:hypothetical protein SEVIR_1G151501v2 [Setaria viridis]